MCSVINAVPRLKQTLTMRETSLLSIYQMGCDGKESAGSSEARGSSDDLRAVGTSADAGEPCSRRRSPRAARGEAQLVLGAVGPDLGEAEAPA